MVALRLLVISRLRLLPIGIVSVHVVTLAAELVDVGWERSALRRRESSTLWKFGQRAEPVDRTGVTRS